jgi:hypothetical protein
MIQKIEIALEQGGIRVTLISLWSGWRWGKMNDWIDVFGVTQSNKQ